MGGEWGGGQSPCCLPPLGSVLEQREVSSVQLRDVIAESVECKGLLETPPCLRSFQWWWWWWGGLAHLMDPFTETQSGIVNTQMTVGPQTASHFSACTWYSIVICRFFQGDLNLFARNSK